MWITRTKNNKLFLTAIKPKECFEGGFDTYGDYLQLPSHLYPNVTADNSPVEYALVSCPCSIVKYGLTPPDYTKTVKEYVEKGYCVAGIEEYHHPDTYKLVRNVTFELKS